MRGWAAIAALVLALAVLRMEGAGAQTRSVRDPEPGKEKRIALVIGMSSYQHVASLDNPKNDAKLMADTLRGLGFALIGDKAQIDLDKGALENAIRTFGRQIGGADVALFYYAGHGLQVHGANWLVPVTANPGSEMDLDFEMVPAALVLKQMEGARTRLNIVLLDACRSNPFGGRGLRDAGGGLAQMKAPEGTLISYATQPGNVAADGSDRDSPYTRALAGAMHNPGWDIFRVFNEVGLEVERATAGSQQPWVSNSPIDGEFYFAGQAASDVPQAAAKTAPTPKPAPAPSFDPRQIELSYWETIKDSKDPADFEDYLKQYPTGSFAGLARNRLTALRAAQTPARGTDSEVATNLPPPRPRALPGLAFGADIADVFPGANYDYGALPVAGEYRLDDVRYVWSYVNADPPWRDFLASNGCMSRDSYVVFLFAKRRLFRISVRLRVDGGCSNYANALAALAALPHDQLKAFQRTANGYRVFELIAPGFANSDGDLWGN